MSDVRLYMNKVNGWEKMDRAMSANQLTHLINLAKLRERSQRVRSLYAQHAALAASRQAITQEMQELIEEGDQLFRSAKEALKEHYGEAQREAGRVRRGAAADGDGEAPPPLEEVGRGGCRDPGRAPRPDS